MARRLILVPILHSSLELGSLKRGIESRAISIYGEEKRKRFQKIIKSYWDSIDKFFKQINVDRVYQDALIADGKLGMRIVKDNADKGIKNYQIVLSLIERGAKLMKTEDKDLVLEEYRYWQLYTELSQMQEKVGKREKLVDWRGMKEKIREFRRFNKRGLIEKRDNYIADRINETLKAGETGVLFIGVEHNVIPKLVSDIEVIQLKERDKVYYCFRKFIQRKGETELRELEDCLTSPI